MSWQLGGFVVEVRLPDVVIVSSARSTDRYADPDLVAGVDVVLWQGRRCGVVVGLESSRAVVLDFESGGSAAAGPIERLRLPGYDPGGLHRLGFHDVDGDVLVTTEIAVARLDFHGHLVWQQVHDDLTVRAVCLDEEALWLGGQDSSFGYELGSGRILLPGCGTGGRGSTSAAPSPAARRHPSAPSRSRIAEGNG